MRRGSRGLIVIGSVLACFLAGAVGAQDQAADNMNILREKARVDKKVVVASVLDLTEREATVFWPVYNAYQSDMVTHYDQLLKLIDAYGKAYNAMSGRDGDKARRGESQMGSSFSERCQGLIPPRCTVRRRWAPSAGQDGGVLQHGGGVVLTPGRRPIVRIRSVLHDRAGARISPQERRLRARRGPQHRRPGRREGQDHDDHDDAERNLCVHLRSAGPDGRHGPARLEDQPDRPLIAHRPSQEPPVTTESPITKPDPLSQSNE